MAVKMPSLEEKEKKKNGVKKEEAERIPGCTRGSPSIADEAEIRLRLELEAKPYVVPQPWAHLPAPSSLC